MSFEFVGLECLLLLYHLSLRGSIFQGLMSVKLMTIIKSYVSPELTEKAAGVAIHGVQGS